MRRNAKSRFVWLIEYHANNGGWYPCSRGSFSLRKDAEKAIKRLFDQEVGYRAAKYVREDRAIRQYQIGDLAATSPCYPRRKP